MTSTEVHQRLTAIFRAVFENETVEISETTTARDIEGWDSITYVNLIVAVEKEFGISFTTKEVMGLTSVGDLIRLITSRFA